MTLVQTEPKKIYMWVEVQPITTAGIYWNEELGLISLSSDGTNRTTIADKNLGATSTNTSSTDSYGYYYQRGNNTGSLFSQTVTTSSTRVNASSYGPGNYYSSSTFIIGYENWDSSNSQNLRGGVTGTAAAMRGPCDEGWHIPSKSEWESLFAIGVSLGKWSSMSGSQTKLKIPFNGYRKNSNSGISGNGTDTYLWSTTYHGNTTAYVVRTSTNAILAWEKARTGAIRPFKNEARPPFQGESGWTSL